MPDFPFSINQDPSYPEMWGSQATSVGHSFVSLPEGGCELGAELREAHLLSERAQQFGRVRDQQRNEQTLVGRRETQMSPRDCYPRRPRFWPWTVSCLGPQLCRWEPGRDRGSGRRWDPSGPPRVCPVAVAACALRAICGQGGYEPARHGQHLNKGLKNKARNNLTDFVPTLS